MRLTASSSAGAWALIVGGVSGAALAAFLAVVPPAVAPNRFSYPFDATGFSAIQVVFFVHHLLIVLGLFALLRAGYAGSGRLARVAGVAAALSVALLAVQELVAISAAHALMPSPRSDVVGALYGGVCVVMAAALIAFGVAVLRARQVAGWRRWLPLVLGIYVVIPLMPAMAGPFLAARAAIGLWFLLFAPLGWALLRPGVARAGVPAAAEGARP